MLERLWVEMREIPEMVEASQEKMKAYKNRGRGGAI
jgi:hypothetical protein